jgi:hypothetical protein
VRAAAAAFRSPAAGHDRQRSVLFLSDGATSGARPVWEVETAVLAAARAASERGIRVYSYALGPEAEQESTSTAAWLSSAAAASRSSTGRRRRQAPARHRLRRGRGARGRELTTARRRALRRFDGSFDALVEPARRQPAALHRAVQRHQRGR